MPLAHGPFLFLYTCTLINQSRNRKSRLLHFAPFFIAYLFLIPFFTLSFEEKILVYQHAGIEYKLLNTILFVCILLSGVIYPLLSLQKLAKHRRTISEQFSFTEKINLLWLRYLIVGLSLIWAVVIFGNDSLIFSAVVLYLFFIGYFGIKQVGIFTDKQPQIDGWIAADGAKTVPNESMPLSNKEDAAPIIQIQKIKYEKSGVDSADLFAIHKELSQIMQHENLYKNPELTLSDVAQKLQVHPNILSQVINSIEQKNFYDYINSQRVEEFKQMITLPQNQKFTLLSLAYECGFNSKTSFNRNFKKNTLLSPTEYLKQINIHLQEENKELTYSLLT
jgi:AraC-like DNA-binding protein